MQATEAAYLAGLLDGEGCLSVHGGRWSRPSIEVCMTTPAPLRQAQRMTGVGSIYSRRETRARRRDVWKWCVTKGDDLLVIVRAVQPWLTVKRADAHVVAIFLTLRGRPGRARPYPVADAHLQRLSSLVKAEDLRPAYQEALDLVVYLRQAIEERGADR
jgi:hypothetical protein